MSNDPTWKAFDDAGATCTDPNAAAIVQAMKVMTQALSEQMLKLEKVMKDGNLILQNKRMS